MRLRCNTESRRGHEGGWRCLYAWAQCREGVKEAAVEWHRRADVEVRQRKRLFWYISNQLGVEVEAEATELRIVAKRLEHAIEVGERTLDGHGDRGFPPCPEILHESLRLSRHLV